MARPYFFYPLATLRLSVKNFNAKPKGLIYPLTLFSQRIRHML
jgi:hypothetical protein